MHMVILKELSSKCPNRYYYIRPYQHLGTDKFHSYKIKCLYSYIKVLKKMLSISSLHMYMLKKTLIKPEVRSFEVLPFGRLAD